MGKPWLLTISEMNVIGRVEADFRGVVQMAVNELEGAIHVDASGTVHRRGSGDRANNNIGALRRAYERHLYGLPPRAPYAGGGTRALPEPTRRRRQARPRSANDGPTSPPRRSSRHSGTMGCSAVAWPGLLAATCVSCWKTPNRARSYAARRRARSTKT